MKIVYINSLYHPEHVGGAEKSVQLLAEAMLALGHEVHVITLSRAGAAEVDSHNGVRIHRVPLRNLYWPDASIARPAIKRLAWHVVDMFNVRSRNDVLSVLKDIQPDIVHTNGLSGFSVAAWSAIQCVGAPIVHSARDYYLIHPNAKLYAKGDIQRTDSMVVRFWSAIKRWESRKVDAFVSISNYVRALHVDAVFFPRARLATVYNPIRIPGAVKPRSEGPWTFGYLGRLDESKGLELLIDAFEQFGGAESRLLIAGKGDPSYEDSLQRRAKGNVMFLGQVQPDMFFPTINCLVTPSRWAEPLGRVVLEAYAQGVPVIGSSAGGIPEIIDEGKTGLTFKSGSLSDLGRCMSEIRRIHAPNAFAQCRAMAEHFSSEAIVRTYAKLYAEIVEDHAVRHHA